jgi:hypothetical protein
MVYLIALVKDNSRKRCCFKYNPQKGNLFKYELIISSNKIGSISLNNNNSSIKFTLIRLGLSSSIVFACVSSNTNNINAYAQQQTIKPIQHIV